MLASKRRSLGQGIAAKQADRSPAAKDGPVTGWIGGRNRRIHPASTANQQSGVGLFCYPFILLYLAMFFPQK